MLRTRLNEALKEALKKKDERTVSTVRLILAALKDRDIADRSKGNYEGISEDEILQMFNSMIKQRRESIAMFEQGGRCELAQRENEEIVIIQKFMPQQLSDAEMETAADEAVKKLGASSLKDMGRVMAALKESYTGRMDFSRASGMVKKRLGG